MQTSAELPAAIQSRSVFLASFPPLNEKYFGKDIIIDDEIKSLEVVKETRKQAEDILKKYKHIKELNKIIIDEFIDKIYIGEIDKETNSRDIEIEWNFEF